MQAWIETLGVTILAVLAGYVGLRVTRLAKPYWCLGYAVPLLLILTVAAARHFPRVGFVPPASWIMAGRNEFVIFAVAIPMTFCTLIPRLDTKRKRIAVAILPLLACAHFVVFPFLVPTLMRGKLSELKTFVTLRGVCLQSTSYTCGPAAAVTALKMLGIDGQESEIAILAKTTAIYGTDNDLLALAIQGRYADQGIKCELRFFDTVAELKDKCPVIATVKFAPMIDHYVTVLEVQEDRVVVGNPLGGREILTHDEFRDRWRFIGIVVGHDKNP